MITILKILGGVVLIIIGVLVIAACMLVGEVEREFDEKMKGKRK